MFHTLGGRLFLAVFLSCLLGRGAGATAPLSTRVLTPPALQAQGDLNYLAQLQQRAQALSLADEPHWRALLHHVRSPLTGRRRSLADDVDFFNAPGGAEDPQAELQATLTAMFDPQASRSGGQAARCRFPGRWDWLRERLAIDEQRLPAVACPAYEQWRQSLQTRSVTLVFPAAYVNSPASMYGHTFFRLNLAGEGGDQPLLAYTISYAAEGVDEGGTLFALKGLLGLYPGVVSNSPYYIRIREYSHLENRDIWEYDLALTPREIDRLLAHAWELGHTRFDYYFFDENCSYQLLALLDVARPGLALTERFPWWTIPVDTVREVASVPGLLQERRYRPSNSSELRHRAALLPPAALAQAQALAAGRPLSEVMDPSEDPASPTPTRVLELAERLAIWRASKGELDDDGLAALRTPLLAARARRPSLPELTVPTPAVAPEQGHRTARVDLMAGQRSGQGSAWLSLRPAYHDVMDPEAGFQRGAQIQFGSLSLATLPGQGLRLEQLVPIDILSLAPRSAVGGGPSWKVRFGLTRAWGLPADSAPLAGFLNGGPGLSWALGGLGEGSGQGLAYVLMDNQLWRDRSREGSPWRLGSGLQGGWLQDLSPRWRMQWELTQRQFVGRGGREQGLLWAQRWSLSPEDNLVSRCEWTRRDDLRPQHSCLLGWQRYR